MESACAAELLPPWIFRTASDACGGQPRAPSEVEVLRAIDSERKRSKEEEEKKKKWQGVTHRCGESSGVAEVTERGHVWEGGPELGSGGALDLSREAASLDHETGHLKQDHTG